MTETRVLPSSSPHAKRAAESRVGVRAIRGRMRRRLLLTYRVDPEVARGIIPDPFRPQLVDGSAVAGVCLIGLTQLRPGWLRSEIGISTENAAHRFAVEWDEHGVTRTGVYVMERHSSSLIPVLGGGRLFPGIQRRARFEVEETDTRFRVRMRADDAEVAADVSLTEKWESSLFASVDEASDFYRDGGTGWSPGRRGAEGVELTAEPWSVQACEVNAVTSTFFDALPAGAAVLDSALVMRDIPVTWRRPQTPRP